MGRKFAGVSEMLLLEEQEVVCLSVSFDDAFIERIFVLVGVDDGRSTVVPERGGISEICRCKVWGHS